MPDLVHSHSLITSKREGERKRERCQEEVDVLVSHEDKKKEVGDTMRKNTE